VRANLFVCSWPWPGSEAATAEAEGAASKAAAADVLSALLAQPTHGPRVSLLLHKLLPPGLVASIAEGPPEAVMRALSQVRVGLVKGALQATYARGPQQVCQQAVCGHSPGSIDLLV
jgi:hypothetical protein